MSETVIQTLLSHSIVKTVCNTVVDDNGNNKEVAFAIQCSLCTNRWCYGKHNYKPSSTMITTHMKKAHRADWLHYCALYTILNDKCESPTSASTSSTSSSDVSPSSSPLVRRASSKRSAVVLSQQVIPDSEIVDADVVANALKTVISAFAVFNISFKASESTLFRRFIVDANIVMNNHTLYRSLLKKSTVEYATELRDKLLLFLKQDHHYVTLATDGWTNTCGDKVWNIMLICKKYKWMYMIGKC